VRSRNPGRFERRESPCHLGAGLGARESQRRQVLGSEDSFGRSAAACSGGSKFPFFGRSGHRRNSYRCFRSSSKSRASILFGPIWAPVVDAWTPYRLRRNSRQRHEMTSRVKQVLDLKETILELATILSGSFRIPPICFLGPTPSARSQFSFFVRLLRQSAVEAQRKMKRSEAGSKAAAKQPSPEEQLQQAITTPETIRGAGPELGGFLKAISGFSPASSDLPRARGSLPAVAGQHARRRLRRTYRGAQP